MGWEVKDRDDEVSGLTVWALVSVVVLGIVCAAPAWARTYTTITDITAAQRSNCVQIEVRADGILDWRAEGGMGGGGMEGGGMRRSVGRRIQVRFPEAKSRVRNFIDVSLRPVSYVQTSIPQDAKEGVGISMDVALFDPATYDISETEDRQGVIISVRTERTLEATGRAEGATIGEQKSELICRSEGGMMSIDALKVDMLRVLGEIAKASGLNIVVDDAVEKRTVSMSLDNMPPEEVVKAIATAYGLAWMKQGDVYMVSEGIPTDLATYRLSGTASFPMKFVQAQTASGLLPAFLYSYVHVNSEQNAVVVSAPTQMLEKIKTDLSKVDTAPPQIMIEALALEVSSTEDLSASLRLESHHGEREFTSDSQTGEITYTTVGELPSGWQAGIKALVEQNKARIHANPRMAVVNGHNADIFIGAQRFIRVQYSSYGQLIERIQGVDVGTKIAVTPWTGDNREITVRIAPQVSNIVELERKTGLPTLSSRQAATTVRVKDGETIMIGGLTTQQYYDTKRRVPILGDLPLIGQLFRSRDRTKIETQLVILITPRILSESGHLPAEEESRIKERMLGH